MESFGKALAKEIGKNWYNNFGSENHDEYRFGSFKEPFVQTKHGLKYYIKKLIKFQSDFSKYKPLTKLLDTYGEGLDFFYCQLNQNDKKILVKIIAYRVLGPRKVKLPLNTEAYWKLFDRVAERVSKDDTLDPGFMHFKLKRTDLRTFGYPIDFYFTEAGIVTDFIIEQYAYKENGISKVYAEEGDVVLDLGGCWGDTALYFASKVGESGHVFSFEFIPGNINIHNINTRLNPSLKDRITLVENPVTHVSDLPVYYQDNGPGSRIAIAPFPEQTGQTKTISIDDFVARNGLEKVDFIKMDIEGAEPDSLRGAVQTIRKFKPKLAIAIYHSMDDFVNIPRWISDLNLGYKLYLGHYKIHAEETILFAKPE